MGDGHRGRHEMIREHHERYGNLVRCASQPLIIDTHAIDAHLTPDESSPMELSVVNELSDTSIEGVQRRYFQ